MALNYGDPIVPVTPRFKNRERRDGLHSVFDTFTQEWAEPTAFDREYDAMMRSNRLNTLYNNGLLWIDE